jgi:2TM domain
MFNGMFKDLAIRVFLIHLAAFIAGVLICAAVNLWLTPGTLWFPWVALGWGAALATHAFALLLRKTRRRERIFIDRKARSFAVHLFAYLATVLILLYVNLKVTPNVWWFYWVALGWGAGVAFHGWCTFFKKRRRLPSHAAAAPAKTDKSPAKKRTPRRKQKKTP